MALFCALSSHAANLATDNASDPAYTNGWTTSSSGGSGWGGGWQLSPASNTTAQGFFIGSSTSNGGGDPGNDGDIDTAGSKAWGVYANSGSTASATRSFSGAILPGQLFTIDMDNGYIDNGMSVGFDLQDPTGATKFRFYFLGGDTQYRISDASSTSVPTGIPFTSSGLHLEFILTSSTNYSLVVNSVGIDGPSGLPLPYTGTLIGILPITRLRIWNLSSCIGVGNSCAVFFNSIALYPLNVWYISATNTNDPLANGSLAHPFPQIQEGLNAAVPLGDTVMVTNGVYSGTGNTNLDFLGKSVTLTSVNGPTSTVVDCQSTGRGFWVHNNEGNASLISGLTITHAPSNDAAIYLQSGSPTINNCIFLANSGKSLKGNPTTYFPNATAVKNCTFMQNSGVVVDVGSGQIDLQDSLFVSNQNTCVNAVTNNSYAAIDNCVFQFNQGTVINDGEFFGQVGISIANSLIQSNTGTACSLQNGFIEDSTIENNQGDGYDEISGGFDNFGSLTMSGVVIQNNSGVGLNAAGDASVDNCTFSSNGGIGLLATPRTGLGPHGEVPQVGAFSYCTTTGNGGGGMGGNSQCTFNSCTISLNSAGGIVGCGGNYIDCLIENNLGPALAPNCSGGMITLNNCTARNNPGLVSLANATTASATIYNSISWGNGANPVGPLASGSFAASYSDVETGTGQFWFGTGCINVDPQFVSTMDSHLQMSSPCVSAGIFSNTPTVDIEGTARGNPPDMGCYEVPKADSDQDGIPDWWRVRYFGHASGSSNDNSLATDDADGTGQNNLFKYIAGLDPTNPSSVFLLQLLAVTNQTAQYDLVFSPWIGRRTYSPQFDTDLVAGVWSPLPGYLGPFTNGNQITVTDTNAINPQKFYRVDIASSSAAGTTGVPSTPGGEMAVAVSRSQVTVTWAPSVDFSGLGLAYYQIYRNDVLIPGAMALENSFSESGLASNTTYCYSIAAFDNAGHMSAKSTNFCVTTFAPLLGDPASPSMLTATKVTAASITLNWKDNSTNEVGFQISRATLSNGAWSVIGNVGANVTNFIDLYPEPSTTYYYEVAAFN